MAARNFAPLRSLQRDAVILFGGGTGASAANLTGVVGSSGFAATAPFKHDDTGVYTINLRDKYNSLLFFSGTVIDPGTTDDWEVVVISESVASDGKIVIGVFKGGAAANLTTDEKLRVMVVLSNTAQKPV
jgi:hypothetical protein